VAPRPAVAADASGEASRRWPSPTLAGDLVPAGVRLLLAQAARFVPGALPYRTPPVRRVGRRRGDDAMHQATLDVLGATDRIDWSRASIDGMHVRASKEAADRPSPVERGEPGSKIHACSASITETEPSPPPWRKPPPSCSALSCGLERVIGVADLGDGGISSLRAGRPVRGSGVLRCLAGDHFVGTDRYLPPDPGESAPLTWIKLSLASGSSERLTKSAISPLPSSQISHPLPKCLTTQPNRELSPGCAIASWMA
jgi:hypothetical protein